MSVCPSPGEALDTILDSAPLGGHRGLVVRADEGVGLVRPSRADGGGHAVLVGAFDEGGGDRIGAGVGHEGGAGIGRPFPAHAVARVGHDRAVDDHVGERVCRSRLDGLLLAAVEGEACRLGNVDRPLGGHLRGDRALLQGPRSVGALGHGRGGARRGRIDGADRPTGEFVALARGLRQGDLPLEVEMLALLVEIMVGGIRGHARLGPRRATVRVEVERERVGVLVPHGVHGHDVAVDGGQPVGGGAEGEGHGSATAERPAGERVAVARDAAVLDRGHGDDVVVEVLLLAVDGSHAAVGVVAHGVDDLVPLQVEVKGLADGGLGAGGERRTQAEGVARPVGLGVPGDALVAVVLPERLGNGGVGAEERRVDGAHLGDDVGPVGRVVVVVDRVGVVAVHGREVAVVRRALGARIVLEVVGRRPGALAEEARLGEVTADDLGGEAEVAAAEHAVVARERAHLRALGHQHGRKVRATGKATCRLGDT